MLGMLLICLFIYCVFLVAGAWLMLEGAQDAPLGYEDEQGFHIIESEEEYARVLADSKNDF
ncbi:MAG: hypothetical protein AAGB46_07005 [Verrucomicrobiota bacterium]